MEAGTSTCECKKILYTPNKLKIQNFLMRGSSISLPSLLEECEDTSLICKLAAKTYDPGQTYANTKVLIHIYLLKYSKYEFYLL